MKPYLIRKTENHPGVGFGGTTVKWEIQHGKDEKDAYERSEFNSKPQDLGGEIDVTVWKLDTDSNGEVIERQATSPSPTAGIGWEE